MQPQEFTVSKGFQGTEDDKVTPQVIQTKAGPCHKYILQVVGQPVPGWMNILRKINPDNTSNPVKEGDKLYGTIAKNQWSKPEFTKAQRPDGAPSVQSAAPVMGPAPANVPSFSNQPAGSEMEAKIDFIISLLENFLDSQNGVEQAEQAGAPADTQSNDGDESPVNLNSLDY